MIQAGMILEGGAARGVFTAGVLDYLMEKDFYVSHVVGVSAGCCNGVDYISKQIGRSRDCMIHKDRKEGYVGPHVLLEKHSLFDMDKVFELLGNSTGIDLCDDLANQVYPMPTSFIGDELTHVGRVRKDLYKDNALSLWITGDQLMKGAAYNSVDIGLKMIELGLLK